jgi:2-polyprenyl-3-methyl-5-hydroxy-6-metoxy-1,4-benzoquinol methylase
MKTYSSKPKTGEGLETVRCPVCGHERIQPLWRLDGYAFARCRQCRHIYQNPRPLPGDLAGRYDEAYRDYEIQNADSFFTLMRLGLADIGFEALEAATVQPRRFLDVGCATGVLVRYLADRGWDALGVELCAAAAEYGRTRRGVNIHTGTLEEAGLPASSMDLIHASHLIEHLAEPGAWLDTVRTLLRPGGYCVLVTPNAAGLQARLLGQHWRSVIADHMHLFTLEGLGQLLAAHGLVMVRWKTWGGLAHGLAPLPVKSVMDRLAKRHGFGDVMVVLCRRPE